MSMFSVGLSGLNAAKQALTTTSHNIANANNPDYNRQEVVVASVEGVVTGAGTVGRGVSVQNVRRLSDAFLSERLNELASQLGFSETRANRLNELDRILSTPDTSLEGAAQNFFKAAQDLSVRPTDNALKQTFIFAAEEVANRLNGLQTNAAALARQADDGIIDSVASINTLSTQIAELNLQISDSTTFQGTQRIDPNDLLDRRAALITQLSSQIEVQTIPLDNGRININTRLGVPLVSEGTSFGLTTRPAEDGTGRVDVVRISRREVPVDPANPDGPQRTEPVSIRIPQREFGTARLGALLQFRDGDLARYSDGLRDIRDRIVSQAETIQQAGNRPALFAVDARTGDLRVGSGPQRFAPDDIAVQTNDRGNDLILRMSNLFTRSESGASIIQKYRELTTEIGNKAAAAQTDVTAKTIIREEVEEDRSAYSGVNLDEEAANLLRYQQAYSASGKVISISQDLFRELLDIAGK